MRGLCHHYTVELHNFAPNVISQAATFIGVCEGFLGIPVNWDLWVHLFRAELHPLTTVETRVRRTVRAGGLSISLWNSRREFYLPCTMTSNNTEWERGGSTLATTVLASPLHRQGAEGEGRLLASRRVSFLAPGAAGVAPECAKGPGGRRARGNLGPRELSSPAVDGRLSYQSSYGFASKQIPCRSQGTLLPSSGEPKVSNPWNNVQCKDSI
jgi:hypothetical protein